MKPDEMMVNRLAPSVYRIVYNYFGCREDAEDIMQDVIIKILTSDKEFESEEHLKSWTIRCTVNECHSLYRNPFRRKRVYPDGDNAWKDDAWWDNVTGRQEDVFILEAEANREAELVRDALSRLHPRYRIALYLYYYEEYSVREVAGMLGKRESTVQTWLARGRRQMADIIEKQAVIMKKWEDMYRHYQNGLKPDDTKVKNAVAQALSRSEHGHAGTFTRVRVLAAAAVAVLCICMSVTVIAGIAENIIRKSKFDSYTQMHSVDNRYIGY